MGADDSTIVPYVGRMESLLASAHSEVVDAAVGPRTELDSHANMVVVGRNCTVFDTTGKTCTVN